MDGAHVGSPRIGGKRKQGEVYYDTGAYRLRAGTVEIGQGVLTPLSRLIAKELGVPIDRTEIISADTEESHDYGAPAASRISFIVTARKLRWECGDSATGSSAFLCSLRRGSVPDYLPGGVHSSPLRSRSAWAGSWIASPFVRKFWMPEEGRIKIKAEY